MTEGFPVGLTLLSSMITPAVLISACGTLIFSTATRLARIVDRVRELSHGMEALFRGEVADFPEERRAEIERQLSFYVRRSRLVQRSLTAFYVALGIFVGATIGIGVAHLRARRVLRARAAGRRGHHGALLRLRAPHPGDAPLPESRGLGDGVHPAPGRPLPAAPRPEAPGAHTAEEEPNPWERLRRLFQREVEGGSDDKR